MKPIFSEIRLFRETFLLFSFSNSDWTDREYFTSFLIFCAVDNTQAEACRVTVFLSAGDKARIGCFMNCVCCRKERIIMFGGL